MIERLGAYREFAPPPDLRDVIDVTWIYARPRHAHRVLPEGGVSLCFESRRDASGAVYHAALTIIGPIRTARFTEPDTDLHLEAVRLKPEWTRELLRADPAEHLNAVDPLTWPRLRDRLATTRTSEEALRLLVDEIRAQRNARTSLAHQAMELLRTTAARVHEVARTLRISERHLRRAVLEATSWTPKHLQRVLRMNRAVATADRQAAPDWAGIAADCGYYDQPHLIAELQALTGRTPAELHAERRAE